MLHHTRRVGANVLLIKGHKILLHRRTNTGWADGMLTMPGGHLNEGETARQAAAREIKEELDLEISPERLHFLTTADARTNHEYICLVFYVELQNDEEPTNAEPEKCSELVWCDPSTLPKDVLDLFRTIIQQGYVCGEHYLEIDQ